MTISDSTIQAVTASGAPPAGGHYAQAVRHGGLVYVSGQLPVRLGEAPDASASFEAQVEQAITNLLMILEASDSDPSHLLKVTVYIVGVENWPAFNGIYARRLGEARPARSIVPVPELHYGYLVEIDAIAAVERPARRD